MHRGSDLFGGSEPDQGIDDGRQSLIGVPSRSRIPRSAR